MDFVEARIKEFDARHEEEGQLPCYINPALDDMSLNPGAFTVYMKMVRYSNEAGLYLGSKYVGETLQALGDKCFFNRKSPKTRLRLTVESIQELIDAKLVEAPSSEIAQTTDYQLLPFPPE
jgi:hypothetical protein